MRLRNSTTWPDYFLRRVVSWLCKRINLSPRLVRKVAFGNRSLGSWSGHAWQTMRIHVSIGPESAFPAHNPGYRGGMAFDINDRVEALVNVTAHELMHLKQYSLVQYRGRGREAECEDIAQHAVRAFREQRESLLAEWSVAPVNRERHVIPITDRRADKAMNDLDRWQRKLKLAQTKVRKCKARVAYYERRRAAVITLVEQELDPLERRVVEGGRRSS